MSHDPVSWWQHGQSVFPTSNECVLMGLAPQLLTNANLSAMGLSPLEIQKLLAKLGISDPQIPSPSSSGSGINRSVPPSQGMAMGQPLNAAPSVPWMQRGAQPQMTFNQQASQLQNNNPVDPLWYYQQMIQQMPEQYKKLL